MASTQEEQEQWDSEDEDNGKTEDDGYLLSDKFDPGVWLEKAAARMGRARKRWFVLHRRERQLAYYTLAFIPPAKAPRKGSIKLDDITGISNKDNLIEISVAKGRSMYKLQADDEKTAADWTYILKVETHQIKPSPDKQELYAEYLVMQPDLAADGSYLSMQPSSDLTDGSYLAMQPDTNDLDRATDGAYLAMQPDSNPNTAESLDPNVTDGAYLAMQPDGSGTTSDVQDGSYLAMQPNGSGVEDGAYLAMQPDGSGSGVHDGSYLAMQPQSELPGPSAAEFIVELERGDTGFGLMFGGGENQTQSDAYGCGIFISGIKTTSPAIGNNNVRLGLQVVSINGSDLSTKNLGDLSPVLSQIKDTMTIVVRENPRLLAAYTPDHADSAPVGYEPISIDASDGYANVDPIDCPNDGSSISLKPEPIMVEEVVTEDLVVTAPVETNKGDNGYGIVEPFTEKESTVANVAYVIPNPDAKKNESPYGIIEPFKESEDDPEKPDTGYDNLDYNDKATDADPNQEPSGGDTTIVEQEDECSYGVIEPFKVNDEDVIPQDEDHESYGVVDQFTTPSETVTQKDFSQTHVVAEGNSSLYLGMDPDAPTTAPQRRTDPDSYHQVSPDASEPVEAPVPVFTGDGITNFVALFPYQATNFDELDVITGHRLCITEVWPDGWAFGKNLDTDKIGIIPGNFLGPAEISLGCPEPSKPDVLTEFPDRYTMVEPDQVQRMTDPTSYQQLTPEGDDVTPPLPEFTGDNKPNYKCSFEFKGSNFDELDSAAGDTLCITEIWPDGWTFGKNLETNKIGIIPGNFVVPIQAVDGVGAGEITQPDVLTEFPDRYSVVEPSLAQ